MKVAVEASGRPLEQLIVLARLLVDAEARRHGLGRRLVELAVSEAHAAGRQPVLDVNRLFAPAIALYESCGWKRVGEATFSFADGGEMHEAQSYVYLGPPLPR